MSKLLTEQELDNAIETTLAAYACHLTGSNLLNPLTRDEARKIIIALFKQEKIAHADMVVGEDVEEIAVYLTGYYSEGAITNAAKREARERNYV